MACSGRRPKEADIRPEQKWDFISLNDFKSTSCFTPFAYGYLWVSLGISVAVYAVDTFTAVNLLAFDRWSGEVKPYIPFNISKWLFSACIIASWVNVGFEHIRAAQVMKRGAVAESYLDSLAVRLQCIRMGKQGRGWRRFLVFAELTKSKKGAEYVALFTFFSFQAWIRVIFCQGPRQVVNALTLYSVFNAKLDPTDAKDVGSALSTFFKNVGILASQNHQQAAILSGMVFTLVIWIFAALSLILAILFYILFLWHYIPNRDGGLSGYCERKINARLARIVSAKVNKALEDEERKRIKADAKAIKKGEKPLGRQATLPTMFDAKDDKLPDMPMLNRAETNTTLPMYSSQPGTPISPYFELDNLGQKRPPHARNLTDTSFASNAPLMDNASEMGFARSGSPAPSLRSLNTPMAGPQRTNTALSGTSNFSRPAAGGPPRMPSAMGNRNFTQSPVSYTDSNPISPSSLRQESTDNYGRPLTRPMADPAGRSYTPAGPPPSMGRRTPFAELDGGHGNGGRASPASSRAPTYTTEMGGRNSPAPSRAPTYTTEVGQRNSPAPYRGPQPPPISTNVGYQSYNPNQRSASASPYQQGPLRQDRNITDPTRRGPPVGDYFANAPLPAQQRSATSMSNRPAPGGYYNGQGRSTPAPNNSNNRGPPNFAPEPSHGANGW